MLDFFKHLIRSSFSKVRFSKKIRLKKNQEINSFYGLDDTPMMIFIVRSISNGKCDCFQARLLASTPEYVVFQQTASGTTSAGLLKILRRYGIKHGILYRKDDIKLGDFIPMSFISNMPTAVF